MELNNEGFEGWHIINGFLVSPENIEYSAGEIRSIQYLYALIAELKTQLRKIPVQHGGYDYSNVVPFPDINARDTF